MTPHVLLATHFHEITRKTPDGQRGVLLANLDRLTFLVMDFIGEEDASAEGCKLGRNSRNLYDDNAFKRPCRRDAREAASSSEASIGSSAVKNIVFLYRVVEGHHPFSHAFQIAKAMELGDAVIDRAVQVLGALTGGEPLDPLETERSKTKHENKKRLLREIAKRRDMTDRDICELRELVIELDLSHDRSMSATGSSRFESTDKSSDYFA